MFSRRFRGFLQDFLSSSLVSWLISSGGFLQAGARMCKGTQKRSETLKANVSPPARTESLYLNMALHEPVLCFLFFFFTERRQEKGRLQLQIKKGNQLYGADEGALFRETRQRVLGHRSGYCCYIRWNRNRPGKSTSLSSHVRIFYPCMRDRERRMCRITNPKPKTANVSGRADSYLI